MALSIMPESEMENFTVTKEWLQNQKAVGCVFDIHLRIYRMPLPFTSCILLKKKVNCPQPGPSFQFVLAYKNFVLQVPLPFVKTDESLRDKGYTLTLFPTPLDEFQLPFAQAKVKLSSSEKIRGEKVELGLTYESMEEILGAGI